MYYAVYTTLHTHTCIATSQYYIHFHQAAVLSVGDCVFVSTQGGWTAFHLAAQEGKVDVVRLLLTEDQTLVNIKTMVMNKLHE